MGHLGKQDSGLVLGLCVFGNHIQKYVYQLAVVKWSFVLSFQCSTYHLILLCRLDPGGNFGLVHWNII